MFESGSTVRRMQPHLGTFVEIGIHVSSDQSRLVAEQAIVVAFSEIKFIHHLLSFHAADSDLTKLNQAQGEYVSLHRHSMRVLRLARAMTALSGGLFNCTVGGKMVSLGVLPNHGGRLAVSSGKASDIDFNKDKVRLKNDVKITLDGIAKGYAVDCAVSKIKQLGINAAWVNAGGDLKVFGDYTLPVQRRELDGSFSALGGLQNASLASSQVGANEATRFPGQIVNTSFANTEYELTEKKSPEIGVWSVISHWAWRADALTKVACLANPLQRAEFVAKLGGVLIEPKNES